MHFCCKLKMEPENRVVVLIDMDCFYCQVEEKLNPELAGKPIAVVQYNPWKGGGIIAVNYVARAMGVTRHMRGDEAKAKCPEIQLPSVPCLRGKADITKYRDAGKDVAKVLQKFTPLLERASIDEAYLDITAPVQKRLNSFNVNSITTEMMPNTYTLGYESVSEFLTDVHNCGSDSIDFDYEHAKRLLVGAVIVSEIRAAVFEETGYRCSAGIAHNKILAKLVCGMNKPNKQTVLPKHSLNILYKTLAVKKVKHLGGKFGFTVCQTLRISTMAELQMFSENELQNKFDEKNGTWLYNIARGIDLEPVQARFNPKSIGCCKQFRGIVALTTLDSVKKWLKDLGDEIEDRLEKDALESNRTPKQMVVSYSSRLEGRETSSSRSYNFTAEDELCGDFFSSKALELIMESSEGIKSIGENNTRLKAPIKFLGISVGKFQDHADVMKTRKIKDYFGAKSSKIVAGKVKDTEILNSKNENSTEKLKDTDKQNKEDDVINAMAKPKNNEIINKDENNDNGKEYILQRFFQATDILKSENVDKNITSVDNPIVTESSLDKQESFFAKILNRKFDIDATSIKSDLSHENKVVKPNTPFCEIIDCGEDSIDTEYSGSTINMEINKSIALFEDDPREVSRIDNIRKLLNNSAKEANNMQEISSDSDNVLGKNLEKSSSPKMPENKSEIYNCSECGKAMPVDMAEMHADYHFALKLRDEERQLVREEIKKNKQQPVHNNKCKPPEEYKVTVNEDKKLSEQSIKHERASISNFLIKLDVTIPTNTCSECGKKIPVEKFLEHLDFHEAQKLSRLLNRKPSTIFPGSANKRKRKSASPVKKLKVANCKSIDSFFK